MKHLPFRQTIREGCAEWDIPRLGWGRILSDPQLRERYWTVRIFGVRWFAARGRYDGESFSWRGWIDRNAALHDTGYV